MHDHPRNRNGYVFEHIVVMETLLGRALRDFETVHHVNGVKNDNVPKNLELWCKPQPSGQRVEDLVDWVISNYPERVLTKFPGVETDGS